LTTVRWRSIVVNAALVLLFAAFAYANFLRWRETGHPVGLGVVALEAMTALLFIFRRPPRETSGRTLAWLSAPVGSFVILLARPAAHPDAGPLWTFEVIQLAGFGLAIVGLGFLGRSFGIVAALRGVKTSGLYTVVRHPIYSSYLIAYLGYVLENRSPRNVGLFILMGAAQLVRISEEERVLVADSEYRRYSRRVRYRLIPFLY
jgi:protein-S-isoprenylcysteine O-methyltransferase Ste14